MSNKHQRRKRCRYCHALVDDIPKHYAKTCVQVAIAFDPDFWPYAEGSHEARNAANARQNKTRSPGLGIVVNADKARTRASTSKHASKRVDTVNGQFNNRVYRRSVGGALVLMAGGDVVLDDASQHQHEH